MNIASIAYAAAPEPAGIASAAAVFANAVYELREIEPTNSLVGKFMNLHQEVLNSLPAHGRHWVKRRLFSHVKQHLQHGHIALGAFDAGGKMVGQVLLTFPDLPGGRNLKGYPIGCEQGQLRPEQCLVVQTLGVSPGHQGKGIRVMLLQKAEEIAHQKYRRHLLAKTDIANTSSVRGFEAAGYVASPETIVPGEAYKCVFMYKPLQLASFAVAQKLQFSGLKA